MDCGRAITVTSLALEIVGAWTKNGEGDARVASLRECRQWLAVDAKAESQWLILDDLDLWILLPVVGGVLPCFFFGTLAYLLVSKSLRQTAGAC